MKKFLLFISCLLALGATSAQADEYTWAVTTTTKVTDISKSSFNYTSDNVKWSFTHESYGTAFHGQRSGSDLQFGSKANPTKQLSMSTDAFKSKKIVSVSLNAAKRGTAAELTLTIYNGDTEVKTQSVSSTTLADYNFDIKEVFSDNLLIAFTNSNSTTGNSNNLGVLFHSVTVVYEDADAPVATPEISIDENDMVSISCETEGVDIYYTINGDEPTADSQKYDAPFELTATATVKAIAINGEDKSNIASKTFTIPEKKTSLENWTEWSQEGTFNITCPLTVIYKSGNHVYVKDADNNYAYVFNQNNIILPDYQNGDVINGMTATFTIYASSQLPEIIPVTVGETTAGTPVEATEITATGVNEDNFFHFVSLSGVSIVAASQARNFTITDKDGASAPMFNQFNLTFTPEEGATYDATGFIGAYKGTYQFQPIEIVKNIPTAIDEIGADVVEGEAEYFNLQGVKINPENATPGLYIRRQGGKVAKVVVK